MIPGPNYNVVVVVGILPTAAEQFSDTTGVFENSTQF